jgi:hypothetical protein
MFAVKAPQEEADEADEAAFLNSRFNNFEWRLIERFARETSTTEAFAFAILQRCK